MVAKAFAVACFILVTTGCIAVFNLMVDLFYAMHPVVTKRIEKQMVSSFGAFAEEPKPAEDAKITRTLEVYDPETRLSNSAYVCGGEAFITLIGTINAMDVSNLSKDLAYFERKMGIKTINFFILSGGGDALAGLAYADEITRAQTHGMTIKAKASGIIASAAVPILAVCNYRVASPSTFLMVHEPSMFKYFASESASDIKSQNKMMDLLQDRYRSVLASRSKKSVEEWQTLERATTWFTAAEALEWGLIDKIE